MQNTWRRAAFTAGRVEHATTRGTHLVIVNGNAVVDDVADELHGGVARVDERLLLGLKLGNLRLERLGTLLQLGGVLAGLAQLTDLARGCVQLLAGGIQTGASCVGKSREFGDMNAVKRGNAKTDKPTEASNTRRYPPPPGSDGRHVYQSP